MKYCVIGAGGTGGSIAAYLENANKDVSLIARGQHLVNLKQQMVFTRDTSVKIFDQMKAFSEEEYIAKGEKPDVIFLCTKAYSVDEVTGFIEKISGENTVIIPVLNGIAVGGKLRVLLEGRNVADGCIYIVAEKTGPGKIFMRGDLLRIVFGSADEKVFSLLEKVYEDLQDTEIDAVLSENIMSDTLRKFSLVSAMAACGLYYNIPMRPVQSEGQEREFFKELVSEIASLADRLGAKYNFDLVEKNLSIIDNVSPLSTTSLQRDIEAGGNSEIESLIGDPIRLGVRFNLEMANYRKVAEKFQKYFK